MQYFDKSPSTQFHFSFPELMLDSLQKFQIMILHNSLCNAHDYMLLFPERAKIAIDVKTINVERFICR